MGTLSDAVPVAGFAVNFSPMSRIAPPPLGSEIEGACGICCFSSVVLPFGPLTLLSCPFFWGISARDGALDEVAFVGRACRFELISNSFY